MLPRFRLWFTALALAVSFATVLPGSPASASNKYVTFARKVIANARASSPAQGSVSAFVIARAGTTLTAPDATRQMQPASLMKLTTTTGALAKLGPTATFATRVVSAVPAEAGVIHGDITLIGDGDPTFSTKAYADKFYTRRPGFASGETMFSTGAATVEHLADAVKAAGVTAIDGGLVVDDSIFDHSRLQHGWKRSYLGKDPDVCYIYGLTIDEGYTGTAQSACTTLPQVRAGTMLLSALRARGVTVAGNVARGVAPSASTEIARVTSPPLSELVRYIDKWSVNYGAEMLLKDLGAHFLGAGTTANGVRVVRAALKHRSIDLSGFVMSDGSGLSLDDRVTARMLSQILSRNLADTSAAGTAMRAALPVALEAGTLHDRTGLRPVAHNLRAKTGMISGVRGMAGWVRAHSGATVLFVALFNRAQSAGALTTTLDKFCDSLRYL